MRTIKLFGVLACISVLGLAGGCLFRLPIQQGNKLNRDLVTQLEPGMTRKQVMFLLGTPMVPSAFDTDRWDYYYYFKDEHGKVETSQRLTVWFKDDKVDHFVDEGAGKPAAPPDPAPG